MKVGYTESGLLRLVANNNRDRAVLNRLFRQGVWTQRLALDSKELDLSTMPRLPKGVK